MILLDTNVLVYAVNTRAEHHEPCYRLIEAVQAGIVKAVLVPQVLLEFYAIITDFRCVEKPLDPETAWREIETLRSICPVIDKNLDAMKYLEAVLNETTVRGAQIFDAFLVAQMRAIGISVICTYNTKDFSSYNGIIARKPDSEEIYRTV